MCPESWLAYLGGRITHRELAGGPAAAARPRCRARPRLALGPGPEGRGRGDPRGDRADAGGLRHRHRDRGRQDGGRRGDRPHPRRRRRRRRGVQARRQRPRRARPGRAAGPRDAALGGPVGRSPTTRSRPTATGPPVSPHLGAELAGEPIDPARLRERVRGGGRRRRRRRLRGRRRLPRPAHPRLPGPRPRPGPRPAGRDRLASRPRRDQPHADDDRVGARRRPRGRSGRPHPMALPAGPGRALEPRDDRAAGRGTRRGAARRSPSTIRAAGPSCESGWRVPADAGSSVGAVHVGAHRRARPAPPLAPVHPAARLGGARSRS